MPTSQVDGRDWRIRKRKGFDECDPERGSHTDGASPIEEPSFQKPNIMYNVARVGAAENEKTHVERVLQNLSNETNRCGGRLGFHILHIV